MVIVIVWHVSDESLDISSQLKKTTYKINIKEKKKIRFCFV